MSSVGARKQLQILVELLLSLEAHTQLFQSIGFTSHVEVYCVLYSREKSQSETVAVPHLDSVVSCGAKDKITGHQAFERFPHLYQSLSLAGLLTCAQIYVLVLLR